MPDGGGGLSVAGAAVPVVAQPAVHALGHHGGGVGGGLGAVGGHGGGQVSVVEPGVVPPGPVEVAGGGGGHVGAVEGLRDGVEAAVEAGVHRLGLGQLACGCVNASKYFAEKMRISANAYECSAAGNLIWTN